MLEPKFYWAFYTRLNPSRATPQNGQTHSNNSSANCSLIVDSVFNHFVELVLKGLNTLELFIRAY